MALTAYALAMDLLNNEGEPSQVLSILSAAEARAKDLSDTVEGHQKLKQAIADSIAELQQ